MYAPRVLAVRNDIRARAREGLTSGVRVGRGEAPVEATYHEGNSAYVIDPLADQKGALRLWCA